MLALTAGPPADGRAYSVVALGAHADDVEIGAAATIMQLLAAHPEATVHWVVFSGEGERGSEAEESARELLGSSLGSLHLHEVRDGFLPREWSGVKEVLLQIARQVTPDIVFAPALADAHQDHRVLGELAWQAFRGALILGYEIPKWEADRLSPSLYVPILEETVGAKLDHLKRHFRSQQDRAWFDDETFRATLRLRGVECGTRYAEAFDARKVMLTF
ncbi:putative LmbE-like protein [Frankia casuarinae]|uniref:LmbE-like protein n=2 Tax=Frankia casuarinae (strain DSM 45818 / CECT 9043 / HFP020203 / CcI3) TaxID=106370 RepID=Q2J5Z2_FRACC|nr:MULTISPECIES: PIG-L family deacetylase [Frankia]ABD13300.1 LmbE-like protein [Frankia casuarinae]ETA03828.1 putative LmbE-like protein [Frankia sp. CcI6]EYT93821.1 putative LmbE-like protein [Frankia casuarinae]KDA44465.1 putative LmbE-like protein [Frankia sp. BMG5.23]KEZ37166.1 putative LmbE-like protein [Frankia sp. CeD]